MEEFDADQIVDAAIDRSRTARALEESEQAVQDVVRERDEAAKVGDHAEYKRLQEKILQLSQIAKTARKVHG